MHQKTQRLLDWYDSHRRDLPWRVPPGESADPYRVWLSEIMLQQTTVKAVIPYFHRFTALWPELKGLAAADLEDVLREWAGLGYYARARNLHACARQVAGEHDGRFPADRDALRKLRGIGEYTSAAIAAIAFNQAVIPVDGNIERVMARFHGLTDPLPGAKKDITRLASQLEHPARSGDVAQALMDLGAMICTPKRPACDVCPWSEGCRARREGNAETLPRKAPRAERPVRRGVIFFAEREDGAVLVRQRPEKGLLGGMSEFPSGPWREAELNTDDALTHAPLPGRWRRLPGTVRHVFTHFALELTVHRARVGAKAQIAAHAEPKRCRWVGRSALSRQALPSVMRKVADHALAAGPDLEETGEEENSV